MNPAQLMLRAAAGGGSGDFEFFGALSSYREIWAEDPGQTPPANDALVGTWRDNGGQAGDWVGGNGLRYVDGSSFGINGKAAWDHRADAQRVMSSPIAAILNPPRTLVGVFMFDSVAGGTGYLFDHRASQQNVATYMTGGNISMYSAGGAVNITGPAAVAGVPYLVETIWVANASELIVNGVSAGVDASGTPGFTDGFKLGTSYGNTFGLDGFSSYFIALDGVPGDYEDYIPWRASLASHYGVSLG